jgi:hypothetical protein
MYFCSHKPGSTLACVLFQLGIVACIFSYVVVTYITLPLGLLHPINLVCCFISSFRHINLFPTHEHDGSMEACIFLYVCYNYIDAPLGLLHTCNMVACIFRYVSCKSRYTASFLLCRQT